MLDLLRSGIPVAFERREFLRVGSGLAVAGLVWPGRANAVPQVGAQSTEARGSATSCILIYLLGGPPHQDMFDLKPLAPAEVRGPFQPIATTLPGIQICEHLPRLAGMAHQYALVRSVSHPNSNHTPMIYYTLTGRPTANPALDNDVRPPQRDDFPHMGAVVARFRGSGSALPGYVAIPEVAVRSSTSGEFKRTRELLRGGGAGFLGPQFDPLAVNGAPGTRSGVPALVLPDEVSTRRFEQRSELLSWLERSAMPSKSTYQELQRRAFVLTGAANGGSQQVFSLEDEPPRLHERYGRHRFGQALLLARRLTEAGVPLVAVHFNEMTICDGWDTHSKNFEALQGELLPMLDQGISALISDLDERGRLAETLVMCQGEFGRTPKINANAGRDHWGPCSSTLLVGGGIRGGIVHGASDKQGAYPVSDMVDPVDIHATMYHCLGLDPETTIIDRAGQPHHISTGQVVWPIVT